MIVKMKLKEKLANDYCEKHKKNWEHYCVAGDAFSAGFKAQRELAIEEAKQVEETGLFCTNLSRIIEVSGEHEVEVEFAPGEHQIGRKSTG